LPIATLEIRVSRREADRPRLLQAVAYGDGAVGMTLRIEVDGNGSLADEAAVRARELVAGADGAVVFQWYEWPRNPPREGARDFVSVVTVSWEAEAVEVHVEDLFE
jgi:hypothetical protein